MDSGKGSNFGGANSADGGATVRPTQLRSPRLGQITEYWRESSSHRSSDVHHAQAGLAGPLRVPQPATAAASPAVPARNARRTVRDGAEGPAPGPSRQVQSRSASERASRDVPQAPVSIHGGAAPPTTSPNTPTAGPATVPKAGPAAGSGRPAMGRAGDAQLAHYSLGDCLGRGAFGSVYRGLNFMTGETVAVKQIGLSNIPQAELGEIMSEIELLRNLKHPNIVKYKGSEKTAEHLYIILEYCENGSLQHICKKFGKFPEGLVGVYISQVLEGLLYLHDQGVIHRDIKGANILTNKDGSVKLADFGVATKTGAMNEYAVVGSPYWMAPEVIDQSGATTASDIWSVGCVVIELLEGKPPYSELDPMPALFRIVQDDCPPLPESASPVVKDFLMHCFQKDANLRVSAKKLLRHPWVLNAQRQLQQMRSNGSVRLRGPNVHDEAVKTVQEWNQILKESPQPMASLPAEGEPSSHVGDANSTIRISQRARKPRPALRTIPPITTPLDGAEAVKLLRSVQAPAAAAPVALRTDTSLSADDKWDDDFEEDAATQKLAALGNQPAPRAQPLALNPAPPQSSPTRAAQADDYSDAFLDEKESSVQKLKTTQAPLSPHVKSNSPPTSLRSSTRAQQLRDALGRYSEVSASENYEDDFVEANVQVLPKQLRLQRSQSEPAVDDNDEDPFSELDDDFTAGDLDANVARDQHARMCQFVAELVDKLQAEASEAGLIEICDHLDTILTEAPEMKHQFFALHGAVALVQLLEGMRFPEIICRILGVLNLLIFQDPEAQEALCLIGAIPVVMSFTAKRFSHDIRLEAAHFVYAMCSTSSLTLQFVLSCRGLKTLVDLIDEDYNEQRDLVWLGVGCVNSVLELQSPASRTNFCRILAQQGLLDPLSTSLLCVITDAQDQYAQQAQAQILQTLLVYSQSDSWMKRQLASRSVLRRILKAMQSLDTQSLVTAVRILKNLSMDPQVLDQLQNCNAIEVLTRILSEKHAGQCGTEISNQVLNAIYNLCRLSKSRQEEAAQAGIIPQLLRVARTNSPMRQFALPTLCDFAHASKATRKVFWQHNGLQFYLQLLDDVYWQVPALEAVLVWLQDETARVEGVLLLHSSISALVGCFGIAKGVAFENLLEPFVKICRLSSGVACALSKKQTFFDSVSERLQHKKAIVRLNLLRIVKILCDASPYRTAALPRPLANSIEALSREDGAVLVRELARDVVASPAVAARALRSDDPPPAARRAASETNVMPPITNPDSRTSRRRPIPDWSAASSARVPPPRRTTSSHSLATPSSSARRAQVDSIPIASRGDLYPTERSA